MAAKTSTPWWRLIRFVAREDNQIYFGQPIDDSLDIGLAYSTQSGPIRANVLFESPLETPTTRLSGVIKTVSTLLPPLLPSEVPTIRALGANFVQPNQNPFDAVKNRPVIPILFYKPNSTLSGPNTDVVIPPCAEGRATTKLNWSLSSVERSKTSLR